MKRVLKQNGSIYLQMDTRINHWMRILMDDIFGYDNFRNEIVWWYKTGGSSKNEYCKNTMLFCFMLAMVIHLIRKNKRTIQNQKTENQGRYRDWETDRKSTRLNSSHRSLSRMPSSA